MNMFTAIARLITGTAVTATSTVEALGKTITVATNGVDALDAKAQAYYTSVKAAAFTYEAHAVEEAIAMETARHIDAMATMELGMRKDPKVFAAFEKKQAQALAAWKAKNSAKK